MHNACDDYSTKLLKGHDLLGHVDVEIKQAGWPASKPINMHQNKGQELTADMLTWVVGQGHSWSQLRQ